MRYTVELRGEEREIELEAGGAIGYGGRHRRAELIPRAGNAYLLLIEGQAFELYIAGEQGRYLIDYGGGHWEIRVESSQIKELRPLFKQVERDQKRVKEAIVAHMPGLVMELKVEEGQEVQEGQGLMVIEAMKMENEIRAPWRGVVEQVGVQEGEEIDRGRLLCYIRR